MEVRKINKDTCTENKLDNALIAVIGRRKREIKEIKRRPRERELVKFYDREKERKRER